MKLPHIALLLAAVMVILSVLPAAGQQVDGLNTIKVGDSIPVFKGRTLDGEEMDFSDIVGRKAILLAFWSIYCKPCVEEISSLIQIQEEFGGSDLEVIGINADSELGVGRIRKFISRYEEFEGRSINYTNIYDEKNAISKLLGVGFLPTVLSVNTRGQVERIFVGFEEKSEQEILEGIRSLLPTAEPPPDEEPDSQTFSVEAVVPLCGFYGSDGWKGSFTGNRDLQVEIDRSAQMARNRATKLIIKQALLSLGITLAEDPDKGECFRPYGVYLMEDPLEIRDNLSNFIREIPLNRLLKTIETDEDFLGTEYRVLETARVNLIELRAMLERLGYETPPRTMTFSIINVNQLNQALFEKALLQQSKFIGYFSFPTLTIYTSVDNFADEMRRMDFKGLRFFIEEVEEDRIELEVWR